MPGNRAGENAGKREQERVVSVMLPAAAARIAPTTFDERLGQQRADGSNPGLRLTEEDERQKRR